jgi:mRNA interferase RelE/StbE
MYEVLLHPDAQKVYANADQALAKKIARCFQQLEQTPRAAPQMPPGSHPNIKALKGEYKGLYRYRIGDYRIIYSVEDDRVQVFVIAIAHRSQAYEP